MQLSYLLVAAGIGAVYSYFKLTSGTAPAADLHTDSMELGMPQFIDASTAIKKQALLNACNEHNGVMVFDDATRIATCSWTSPDGQPEQSVYTY